MINILLPVAANPSLALVTDAIEQIRVWERALQARSARDIRRTELHARQQNCLARLAELRFQAPADSSFRSLLSNLALIASREQQDIVLEQWLFAIRSFLEKQLRARDPLNWKGESRSASYDLELALPRGDWPAGFSDG